MRPATQLRLFADQPLAHAEEAVEQLGAGVVARMTDPVKALQHWIDIQQPPFRKKTRVVYTALWTRFWQYLDANGVVFSQVNSGEIKQFLASREGVKRNQRERYQNLIERLFRAVLVAGQDSDHYDPGRNPAALTNVMVLKGESWRDAPANAPMQFLGHENYLLLRAALVSEANRLYVRLPTTLTQWRAMRDIAMCVFILVSGSKVSELALLSVNCIVEDGSDPAVDFSKYFALSDEERGSQAVDPLRDATHAFQGEGVGVQRIVPLPSWAHEILQGWLRFGHHPGDDPARTRLFPAARRPTLVRPSLVMNAATINRIVVNWGHRHAAGMSLTPQRLRNTCGSKWLEEGLSLEEVERRMGYASGAAAGFRLRQAWDAWTGARKNR